jgi:exodeoxyribonuclease V alpha subunit
MLGDGRQLAAVGVGSVFADLCAAAAVDQSPLGAAWVELKKSRRFSDDVGIGALAADIRAIDAGQLTAEAVADKIAAGAYAGVRCLPTNQDQPWSDELLTIVLRGYHDLQNAPTAKAALNALAQFRVLAALREGPFGVKAIDDHIAALLGQDQPRLAARRPLLIVENTAEVGLYNGDTGVTFTHDQQMLAYFDSLGERGLSLARLPRHSSAYAMTIHKSQGSEYQHVAVILPWLADNASHPLLSRELLYTAITRAREKVWLVANRAALIAALSRKVDRASGLLERILQPS